MANPALDQGLKGTAWTLVQRTSDGRIGNWEFVFLPGGLIRPVSTDGVIRTWRWWSTGPRSIHVQMTGDPQTFDPAKGLDFTFNDALTAYEATSADGAQSGRGARKGAALPR